MGRPEPAEHQTTYSRYGYQGTLSQQELPTFHRYLAGRTFSRTDSICGLRSSIQADRRQKRAVSSAFNREKIALIRVWLDRPNRCRRQERRSTRNGPPVATGSVAQGRKGLAKTPKTAIEAVRGCRPGFINYSDLFSDDFSRVLVDNHRMYRAIRGYIMAVAPHMVNVVKQHKGKKTVFAAARIEDQINEVFDTKVQLPSGGSVIIEATEAMHVIDVNSGRTRGKQNAEKTALRVNLEAVEVIARQIRLRDLSGLIVVDFIDLRHDSNREKVNESLAARLATDRVTSNSLPMSDYGIVQITRERKRVSVTATHRLTNKSRVNPAPPPDPNKVAKNIERWLGKHDGGDLHLHVHPFTAAWLEHGSWRRTRKSRWQRQYKHRIRVVGEKSLRPDEFRFLDAKSGHDITDLSPRMVRIKAAMDRDASKKPKAAPKAKRNPNTNGQTRRKQQPKRTADKT